MKQFRIHKDDKVMVIAGKDEGKIGKVLKIMRIFNPGVVDAEISQSIFFNITTKTLYSALGLRPIGPTGLRFNTKRLDLCQDKRIQIPYETNDKPLQKGKSFEQWAHHQIEIELE